MRFGDVEVLTEGHIAVVEIQRPPHNFFDLALIASLADAFEMLDASDDCRASVLAAHGKSFCAGANFQKDENEIVSGAVGSLYDHAVRLFACRKPIVAAIQGAAIGGGLGVALVADFRLVSQEARFAANFVKLNIHPGFGLTHTLPRLIGVQKASLMFLTGRRIGGEEAVAWGLADALVPAGTLRDEAMKLAMEIAECAPAAVESTRATLRRGLADAVKVQTDHEFVEQSRLARMDDHAEGIRAVTDRRVGVFTRK